MVVLELVNAVSNYLNVNNGKVDEFIDRMLKEHRLIQAFFTRLCLRWIERNAELDDRYYDARNEYEVKVCKEIVKSVKW